MLALLIAGSAIVGANAVCLDFDRAGCQTRSALPGFCKRAWGLMHCCETCSNATTVDDPDSRPARVLCEVPRQRCVRWVCEDRGSRLSGSRKPVGTSCRVALKQTASCQRCAVVDAESCAPFTEAIRVCQADGSWSGAEPACRRFCDKTYTPPAADLPRMDWKALAAANELQFMAEAVAPLEVVPISAPPHGPFLVEKKVDHYMSDRIDVFGQWLVMFTPKYACPNMRVPCCAARNMRVPCCPCSGRHSPPKLALAAALLRAAGVICLAVSAGAKLGAVSAGAKLGAVWQPGVACLAVVRCKSKWGSSPSLHVANQYANPANAGPGVPQRHACSLLCNKLVAILEGMYVAG